MKTLLVTVAVAGITFAARGGDGRIPIHQATTISQSGSYVLTRDLSISSGSAITITGNPTVIFDMAGHSIVSTAGNPIFNLNFSPSPGEWCGSFTLRNGEVKGNPQGISTPVGRHCPIDVRIEDVRFNNADVYVEDGSVVAIGNRFVNADLFVDANFTSPSAILEHNQIQLGAMIIFGMNAAQIRQNTIQSGSITVNGSDGQSSRQHIVEKNMVTDGSIVIGFAGSDGIENVAVVGNVTSGAIQVRMCHGCRVTDNVSSGCSSGSGIRLTETHGTLVEGNRVRGCAYGIEFDALSTDNVWRNNILRNNTAAVLNSGANNTDAGGNVF